MKTEVNGISTEGGANKLAEWMGLGLSIATGHGQSMTAHAVTTEEQHEVLVLGHSEAFHIKMPACSPAI